MGSDVPELIVHIGAGKTGSTAIQFSLKRAGAETLAGQGTTYAGLMLENLPGGLAHDWCEPGEARKFFQARETGRTDEEVYQFLTATLKRLKAQGQRQLVWSNEAFLVQNARIIPILQRLARDGVPLRVIAYVRRHDARARSAYVEFGIKSKRYNGDLKTFGEWADSSPVTYGDNLATWQAAFPDALRLYNFDAAGDVSAHFCDQIGLKDIASVRANESPSRAELAAWSVFNGESRAPTWANDFRRLARPWKLDRQETRPVPPLEELMPDADDLRALQARCADDLEAVNAILSRQGQPLLEFGEPRARDESASSWEMDRELLRMVFSLQRQVQQLKREIREMKADGGDAE